MNQQFQTEEDFRRIQESPPGEDGRSACEAVIVSEHRRRHVRGQQPRGERHPSIRPEPQIRRPWVERELRNPRIAVHRRHVEYTLFRITATSDQAHHEKHDGR